MAEAQKSKRGEMMKKFLARTLMLIGAWVVVMAIVGVITTLMSQESLPERIVLEIDFEREFAEYIPADPLASVLMERTASVRDIVDALHQAASDERILALVARAGNTRMGLAEIQEVRDAVSTFRESGKPTIAYAETFGEFGPGNGAYYLATAFDRIYLQPSGDIGLTGLMAESTFVSGTLEKLGLSPRMDHRYEYKNALNMFTEKKYTQPHREALLQIIESQFGQIVQGIAAGRGLEVEAVRTLVDRGPFLGAQALTENLVDGLAYRDEVRAGIDTDLGEEAERVGLFTYLRQMGRPHSAGEAIALIYGVGGVQRGKSEYSAALSGPTMGADSVSAAFRDAVQDDTVRAILFRVDSPGGSYVASDTIWRETVRAKAAGKPVIVSMGNVAGSGGYFVAAAADKIVAQPGTITGSIGVFGGKLLTAELMEKIGISSDEVHTSTNATMWSSALDYTPQQWRRITAWLDHVYEDFTHKVAQGRGLTQGEVHAVAKGRIWTGEDAKDIGLIDELGGFPLALSLAKQAAGIAADTPVQLKLFPAQKTLLETVLSHLQGREDAAASPTAAALRQVMQAVRPVIQMGQRLGLWSEPGVLTMPYWETAW